VKLEAEQLLLKVVVQPFCFQMKHFPPKTMRFLGEKGGKLEKTML
jgi:hypothetical protein